MLSRRNLQAPSHQHYQIGFHPWYGGVAGTFFGVTPFGSLSSGCERKGELLTAEGSLVRGCHSMEFELFFGEEER